MIREHWTDSSSTHASVKLVLNTYFLHKACHSLLLPANDHAAHMDSGVTDKLLSTGEFLSEESMSDKDQLYLLPFCCPSLLDTGFLKNGDPAWSFLTVASPAPE